MLPVASALVRIDQDQEASERSSWLENQRLVAKGVLRRCVPTEMQVRLSVPLQIL